MCKREGTESFLAISRFLRELFAKTLRGLHHPPLVPARDNVNLVESITLPFPCLSTTIRLEVTHRTEFHSPWGATGLDGAEIFTVGIDQHGTSSLIVILPKKQFGELCRPCEVPLIYTFIYQLRLTPTSIDSSASSLFATTQLRLFVLSMHQTT